MQLTSQDMREGETLPKLHVLNGMGYEGGNVSPQLQWQDAPAATKSFVVTCFDPDAPTGSGWWHWVVANIPATTQSLIQGAGNDHALLPKGALQTRTDFGKAGYGGAAPPAGESHRYVFTVHALDIEKLSIDQEASGALVGFNIHFHKLASASLTVTYC